jgi:hypothetical protein
MTKIEETKTVEEGGLIHGTEERAERVPAGSISGEARMAVQIDDGLDSSSSPIQAQDPSHKSRANRTRMLAMA